MDMSTKTFQTIRKGDGDEEIWTEAAKLFSEHYGAWGLTSGRAGERVKASKKGLGAQYLPDERTTYTRAIVDGVLAGQALTCRWEHGGKAVCWITQLVVHRDYRRQGLATSLLRELREDGDDLFGIMSSNPAACLAFANAYIKSIEKVDLSFVEEHAPAVLKVSPVQYVRDAVPSGTLFGDEDRGLVSGADSRFYVDHTEPCAVLESVRREYWPLGVLPDGHEFLLLQPGRHRKNTDRGRATATETAGL